ncbi:MAG: LamG-like jellyroll fold domain-containing protein, partial [Verrucomicrobiales bacterium]
NQIQAGASAPFFYAGSSLPDNLVARWSFEEGAGTTAEDGEGGNTLSLQQSPGWAIGNDGTALELNGSSQFGSRGDTQLVGAFPSMSTGGATEFTLAAWVYLNRTGHRHPMMTKQGNETRGILWSVDENNRMNLQLFKNQSSSSDTASISTLAANRWYHLAVTYSFAGDGSSRVRLYIDGAPSGGTDSAVGPPAPNAVDLNIGRYWWSSAYSTFFDGRIDEFMIWDRELDPGEISQVHSGVAATVATPEISPPGGEFVTPVEVDITSATTGAEIFFTLDGSEPTAGSTPFTSPVLISESTTIRARAFAAGMIPSDSAASTFTRIEASGDWWNTNLPFRQLCTVAAGGYPRTDLHCAVIPIDLGDAVPNSLRVVEIN